MSVNCKICGQSLKSNKGIPIHLRYKHNMIYRTYYDSFLKNPEEGICPVCRKETTFSPDINKYNILQENEIDYHPKGIKYIGYDNREHYYFPDFYIPKWNLIIEIKSIWTDHLDKNIHLKESYVLKQNFQFLKIKNSVNRSVLNFEEFNAKYVKG